MRLIRTLFPLLFAACAAPVSPGTLTVTPPRLTLAAGTSATCSITLEAPDADGWTLTATPPPGLNAALSSILLAPGRPETLTVSADAADSAGQATVQLEAARAADVPAVAEVVVEVTRPTPVTGGGSGGGAGGGAGGGGGAAVTGGGAGGGTSGASATTDATVIVEPSDDAAALLAAIRGARSSIHLTMYILSSTSIIDALINQKAAGREVKVVLNQTFPGGAGSNQAVYTQLTNAGVEVHWAPSTFSLTHEKTVILDGATAWIMTMNAANTSPTQNREYLVVDREPDDVAEADALFAADFAGTAWIPSGKLVVSPVNSRASLVVLIRQATATIDVEAEALSDPQIANELSAAGDRGVKVQVVLCDNPPTTAQSSAIAQLKQHGVKLVTVSTPYIHAKALVVDEHVAYLGSENFTAQSLLFNRELGVLVSAPAEVQKVVNTSRADFARGRAL